MTVDCVFLIKYTQFKGDTKVGKPGFEIRCDFCGKCWKLNRVRMRAKKNQSENGSDLEHRCEKSENESENEENSE